MNEIKINSELAEYVNDYYYISNKTNLPKIGQQGCCNTSVLKNYYEEDINDAAFISDAAKKRLDADKFSQEGSTLTPEEKKEVEKLKEIDREVRAHEQKHIAASAGINASSPDYTYVTGPDGKSYAVEGKVNVSFRESSDPKETIRRAQIMKSAAMAPSDPSGQDFAAAEQAQQAIDKAEQKLTKENYDKI